MTMEGIEIRVCRRDYGDHCDVFIFSRTHNGRAVVKDVVFEEVEPGEYIDKTLSISNTSAQILMDSLWSAGLRPTEGTGSAGSLKATERHLEDMRKIAFMKLYQVFQGSLQESHSYEE